LCPQVGRTGRDFDGVTAPSVLVKEAQDQVPVLLFQVREPGGGAAAATPEVRRAFVFLAGDDDACWLGHWRPSSGKRGTAERAGCRRGTSRGVCCSSPHPVYACNKKLAIYFMNSGTI
jgi:hypothetical protein